MEVNILYVVYYFQNSEFQNIHLDSFNDINEF